MIQLVKIIFTRKGVPFKQELDLDVEYDGDLTDEDVEKRFRKHVGKGPHVDDFEIEKWITIESERSVPKPPLGLIPKELWLQERLENIKRAIIRYAESEYSIPVEWIEERDELLEKIKNL
jgi:hypothetical protein